MTVADSVIASSTRRRLALALAVMVLGLVAVLPGCVPEEETGPQITSVEVDPNVILKGNTGMTDQYVDVTLTVAGFEGEISESDDSVDVFLQLEGENREGFPEGGINIQGDTIFLDNIAQTWFGGLSAGEYQVGATVVSDTGESVTELDLTTITIRD